MNKKLFKAVSITLVISTLLNFLPIGLLKTINQIERIIKVEKISNYDAYANYFDNISIKENENYIYRVNTNKKIDRDLLSGIQLTNSIETNNDIIEIESDEQLDVDTDVIYNPMKESMEIDLTISDYEGNYESIDVDANPHINENGSVSGIVYTNGEKYDIKTLLELAENDEIDENSLSVTVICIIVGALIGATIGGIGAYNLAKVQKKSVKGTIVYVVGGITIGGAVGALIGVQVGQLGSVALAKVAAAGNQVTTETGFRSFYLLKKYISQSVVGQQFHHLVSQGYGNVERFGNEMIHNTKNIAQISDKLHRAVTAYYNSKHSGAYDNLTFRQYMSKKNWQEQYRVAVEILNKLASELGESARYF